MHDGVGRQLQLVMLALDELLPGVVCRDTKCPHTSMMGVPHMANDGGPHPAPYGYRSTRTHEWRRRSLWRRFLDVL